MLEDNKKLEQILTAELKMPTIKRSTLKIAGFGKSSTYDWEKKVLRESIVLKRHFKMFEQISGTR